MVMFQEMLALDELVPGLWSLTQLIQCLDAFGHIRAQRSAQRFLHVGTLHPSLTSCVITFDQLCADFSLDHHDCPRFF